MDVARFALLGLGLGAIYALMAQSLTVVHRGSGVLNFAAGAMGTVGAYTFYRLWLNEHIPWILALICAMLVSGLLGLLVHFGIMRQLENAPPTSRIVATLGLFSGLVGFATLVFSPDGAAVAVPSILPTRRVGLPFSISIGADRFILAGFAIVVTAGLVAINRYTRFGLATSAVAESREMTSAFGWSPDLIAGANWAIGAMLATLAVIGAANTGALEVSSLSLVVVPALAVGLVGRFESFGSALLGAFAVGAGSSVIGRYVSTPGWPTALPLFLIVIVLIFRGRSLPTKSDIVGRLPAVAAGKFRPAGILCAGASIVVILTVTPTWIQPITATVLFAFVVLSVVVVAGYAGQLSMAQLTIAGLSALITAVATVEWGISLEWAIPVGVALTVPMGLLVAIPALRTRGSNLAIATLALSVGVSAVVLNSARLTLPLTTPTIGPLRVFGIDLDTFTNPRRFAIFCLLVLLVLLRAVSNVRRGATGRRVLAARANERAAASLGIWVPGVKLYAFGIGALVAALGGSLMLAEVPVADFSPYTVLGSINAVLFGVVGGLGWPSGAPVGATGANGGVTSQLLTSLHASGAWVSVIGGGLGILVITFNPDGVIAYNTAALSALFRRFRRPRRYQDDVCEQVESADRHAREEPPRARSARVEVRDVTVRFGGQFALNSVSLEFATGEIVGLIGANGAGKSTVIEVASGFQVPATGSVLIDGRSITNSTPSHRARLGIGRSFQSLELFEDMTVVDNLRAAADACPPARYVTDVFWPIAQAIDAATQTVIDDFRLSPLLDKRPGDLDYGKRRLVAIARSLAASPPLVMLDEPAAGLDDMERTELARLLQHLRDRRGIGVLLVEHDVDLVFECCDRIVVLDAGSVIASGTPAEVRSNPRVIAAYLGTDEPPLAAPGGGSVLSLPLASEVVR